MCMWIVLCSGGKDMLEFVKGLFDIFRHLKCYITSIYFSDFLSTVKEYFFRREFKKCSVLTLDVYLTQKLSTNNVKMLSLASCYHRPAVKRTGQ